MISLVCALSISVSQKQVEAAQSFIGSLSAAERASAVLRFGDPYRENFQFVPIARKGVSRGQLGRERVLVARGLLQAFLSKEGVEQVEQIRLLEDVLRKLEGNPGRDKNAYFYTFFGEPSPTGVWGWRYEGHHLSLNFTFKDGELISSSPQFLGANPAIVQEGPFKGTEALAEETNTAFALVSTITPEQAPRVLIGQAAPRDIYTGNARVAAIEDKKGLPYNDMTAAQQTLLKGIVVAHANVQNEAELKRRLERIEKAGWENVVFAWMGPRDMEQRHYYRVQGPTFLIEFDNYQNNANHIHSVWRDFDGDFGRDVLGDHLSHHEH